MRGQCARPLAIWAKFSFPLAAIHAKMPTPKSTFSTGLALDSARLISSSVACRGPRNRPCRSGSVAGYRDGAGAEPPRPFWPIRSSLLLHSNHARRVADHGGAIRHLANDDGTHSDHAPRPDADSWND